MFEIHVQCSNQCSKYFKILLDLSHTIQISKAAIKFYPRISLLVQVASTLGETGTKCENFFD